ncbi:MAG: rhodanese-like domain-containing protein [Bacteroidota bacterium]
MDTGQVILYGILGFILALQVVRRFQARKIPRYGAVEAAERVHSGSGVLVDVRTAAERSHLSIPGSLHIPMNQMAVRMSELERHRDKEIIFYCATGSRSIVAAVRVQKKGFHTANLDGGIATWQLSQR